MKLISRRTFAALLASASFATAHAAEPTWVTYEPKPGPGKGKHLVFLTGDEEYRSEEGLPMLAKILSQRHGFKCTVLFALDPDGTINPENQRSLADSRALESADAIVMSHNAASAHPSPTARSTRTSRPLPRRWASSFTGTLETSTMGRTNVKNTLKNPR